jgi:flagellar FliL protein
VTPDPITTTPTPTPIVEVKPGEGIIIATGTKIINLSGTNTNKYIRITISLEFSPEDNTFTTMKAEAKTAYLAEFNTNIASITPIIDDVIITSISLKTFDDLYTAAGKEKLRGELLKTLNSRLTGYKIISVYFTEFVIN